MAQFGPVPPAVFPSWETGSVQEQMVCTQAPCSKHQGPLPSWALAVQPHGCQTQSHFVH